MERKTVLFAFNGDPMCFVHVLLNALNLHAQGYEGGIVLEGAATGLVTGFAEGVGPLTGLYREAKQKGLILAVCKACSAKMGSLEAVQKEGLPLADDMNGHPSMAKWLNEGYQVITF